MHVIPMTISEQEVNTVLPQSLIQLIPTIPCFVVENLRTARRFLKKVNRDIDIDALTFHEIDKHGANDYKTFLQSALEGNEIGLVSESGLPTVADPGAGLVAAAHENNIEVVVHSGPSSVILAIAGSGLNGQSFSFEGYLPKDEVKRKQTLQKLEDVSRRDNRAIALIETPYRNDHMLSTMMKSLQPTTRLCIAIDITGEHQSVVTKTIGQWSSSPRRIGKIPAVFVFQA